MWGINQRTPRPVIVAVGAEQALGEQQGQRLRAVAGRRGRPVGAYRQLRRTRHLLDPAPGGPSRLRSRWPRPRPAPGSAGQLKANPGKGLAARPRWARRPRPGDGSPPTADGPGFPGRPPRSSSGPKPKLVASLILDGHDEGLTGTIDGRSSALSTNITNCRWMRTLHGPVAAGGQGQTSSPRVGRSSAPPGAPLSVVGLLLGLAVSSSSHRSLCAIGNKERADRNRWARCVRRNVVAPFARIASDGNWMARPASRSFTAHDSGSGDRGFKSFPPSQLNSQPRIEYEGTVIPRPSARRQVISPRCLRG